MSDEPLITTVDLLRHGEVEGGNYYRGQIDDPLTDKGWQQMQSSVANHKPWDMIVTSSLSRCYAFASKLSEIHQLPLLSKDEFREIHFGKWQGKTSEQLMQTHAEELGNYWRDPESFTPPEAEPVSLFRQRVLQAWQVLINEFTGQHVLLVSHGGVMGMILSEVLAIPVTHLLRLDIKYAALSRIEVSHYNNETTPRLIFHNGKL